MALRRSDDHVTNQLPHTYVSCHACTFNSLNMNIATNEGWLNCMLALLDRFSAYIRITTPAAGDS